MGVSAISATLVITDRDFEELSASLGEVADGRRAEIRVETLDADFIIEAERLESPNDVSVRFWHGEPYLLMRGYRFVVDSTELRRFAADILSEARQRS